MPRLSKLKDVFKRDVNDDSEGLHSRSFGIELLIGEEANENERSTIVALLCVGSLRKGMVFELDRVLRECDDFFSSMSVTYDGAVLLRQW